MSLLLVVTAASLVTYALRTLFVHVIPPSRLPQAAQQALVYVGPSAMAALATAAVLNGARNGAGPVVHLAALATAVALAQRTRSVAITVTGAVATASIVQLAL